MCLGVNDKFYMADKCTCAIKRLLLLSKSSFWFLFSVIQSYVARAASPRGTICLRPSDKLSDLHTAGNKR